MVKIDLTPYITARSNDSSSHIAARTPAHAATHTFCRRTLIFHRKILNKMICSVLRASKFAVLKLVEIVIVWVYYTIPLALSSFGTFG